MNQPDSDLAIENEQLRIEISRLKAELQAQLAALRELSQMISSSNCKAMGMMNHLMGTNR